ncbi:hypothetical protein GGR54DRAFT_636141 [Hypoxylon sp. NC1633]|nr:hypothetical protein GGR54DRAFT_636141 [Hypoxylon sp. NC1633]
MESISDATCSLGLIAFSLENAVDSKDPGQGISEKDWKSIKAFASAIEELLEILETLDTSPQNPVTQPPQGFEQGAENCAIDIEEMRRGIKENNPGLTRNLKLDMEKVRDMTLVLESHSKVLRPYIKSLVRGTYLQEGFRYTDSTMSSAIFELDSQRDIDTSGAVPSQLRAIARSLEDGMMDFSGPQLYHLLKILKEMDNLEYPEDPDETSDSNPAYTWEELGEALHVSRRGLCEVALSTHPEDPTPEAREAIVTLQGLILALRKPSSNKVEADTQSSRKRKIEIDGETESPGNNDPTSEYRPVKRMKIDVRRLTARKSPGDYWIHVRRRLQAKAFD